MTYTVAPVLETERLRLRPHRLDDFEAIAQLYASDRSKFMDGPLDRNRSWYDFGAYVGQWALMGFGTWAIDLKSDGQFVGQVGLNKPIMFPENELGWLLFEGCEGHGYATEAALSARDFAYNTVGMTTLVSYIDPPNARSIAVAERLGATLDPNAASPSPDDLVYRHSAPETLQ